MASRSLGSTHPHICRRNLIPWKTLEATGLKRFMSSCSLNLQGYPKRLDHGTAEEPVKEILNRSLAFMISRFRSRIDQTYLIRIPFGSRCAVRPVLRTYAGMANFRYHHTFIDEESGGVEPPRSRSCPILAKRIWMPMRGSVWSVQWPPTLLSYGQGPRA